MKNGWKDEEVKDLFQYVEETKNRNEPLKKAFILHARKYGRQPNSVRNYYYHEVDELAGDKGRASRLQINIKNHEKNEINYFSAEEEKGLMQKIENLIKEGNSVRKACLILSDGDVDKMLRYQNKYRNYISKCKKVPQQSNIIKFATKKTESLSDADIQGLFMGLVKLVKKTALEEASNKYRQERSTANEMLRKAIVDINRREREIKSLKEEFVKLKAENTRLQSQQVRKNCSKADRLTKNLQKEGE